MNLFIIIWHHRHGIDASLVKAESEDALEKITNEELVTLAFGDTDFNEGDKARLESGEDQLEIRIQDGEVPILKG